MEGASLRRPKRGNMYIYIRFESIIYFLKVLFILQSSKEFDLSTYWNPKVTISNGIGDLKYTTTIFMEYDHTDRAWVIERRRTNGQFFEFMELNKFPFDGQVWSFGTIFFMNSYDYTWTNLFQTKNHKQTKVQNSNIYMK